MKTAAFDEEVFNKILDSLPFKFYVVDRGLNVVMWNSKAEEGPYGVRREDALGRPLSVVLRIHRDKVVSPNTVEKVYEEFMEVFEKSMVHCVEEVSLLASGEKRFYHVKKSPLCLSGPEVSHVAAVVEDVTEKRRLEAKLIARERLSSLGEMAAGIAHQINNPLTTIVLCLDSLFQEVRKGAFVDEKVAQKFHKYLGIVQKEMSRCQNITAIQMKLGMGRHAKKARADVNETIADVLSILRSMKKFSGCKVETSYDMEPLHVFANEALLNQAFFALATNAFEAMSGGKGLLKVSTSRENEGGRSLVRVVFRDNGCGIDEARLHSIFTPFFTTKSENHTGLGLYLTHEIVTELDGWVEVESTTAAGSSFAVFLPAHMEQTPNDGA